MSKDMNSRTPSSFFVLISYFFSLNLFISFYTYTCFLHLLSYHCLCFLLFRSFFFFFCVVVCLFVWFFFHSFSLISSFVSVCFCVFLGLFVLFHSSFLFWWFFLFLALFCFFCSFFFFLFFFRRFLTPQNFQKKHTLKSLIEVLYMCCILSSISARGFICYIV